MKIKLFPVLFLIFAVFVLNILFNIQVTTRQGVDFKVSEIKIPLYLKVLNFMDRHYNYKNLVRMITSGKTSKEQEVLAILNWTNGNIRQQPAGLPVVDDHVSSIIIRGYGVSDQYADVFSTLCNYAKAPSFFDYVLISEKTRYVFSFVQIESNWHIFDPHEGVYFVNEAGNFASLEQLREGKYVVQSVGPARGKYPAYDFINLPKYLEKGLNRSKVQSPVYRFLYFIEHGFKL